MADQAGSITTRQEFAGVAVQSTGDVQTTGAESRAAAEIQAAYVMARRFLRDEDNARLLLKREAARPGVAETALYSKPVGRDKGGKMQFAVGFSIRFAEVAARIWGNVTISARASYEDAVKTILTTRAIDLQTNYSIETDSIIQKTVERKDARGRTPKAYRQNSYGEQVVIVDATEDEYQLKYRAERSKGLRDCILRLIPRDLLDECKELVEATAANEHAKDPDAAKRKIFDKFASVGVLPSALKEYLDKPVEVLTAADLQELAVLYNGLKDGDFVWGDVVAMKTAPAEGDAPPPAKVTKLRDKILGAREPKAEAEGPKE